MKKITPEERIKQLEKSLEQSQARASKLEMSYKSLHLAQMKLVSMLLNAGTTEKELGDYVRILDALRSRVENRGGLRK